MIKRWAEKRLNELLSVRPGVNLTGARQVGKSTLAGLIQPRQVRRYTLDDKGIRRSAADDPNGFVRHAPGETLVIDEMGWLRLRTLSLGEINGSQPTFLHRAFDRSFAPQYPEITKRDAIHLAFQGGYPEPGNILRVIAGTGFEHIWTIC